MIYRFSAKTKAGYQTQTGEIEAPNPSSARKVLQEKGLIVFALVPARKAGDVREYIYKFIGVTVTDKVRFTDQLASMVKAGLALTKSLDLLITQTKNPNLVELVKEALSDVESGSPLSQSLAKHRNVFSNSYIALVKAGEASGQLGNLLERLAHNLEKQRQFQSKVKGALIYPVIVTITMIAVFCVVMIFVVPQMADMYKQMDVELPFATVALIATSDFMVNYWYVVLIGTIIAGTATYFYRKTPNGQYFFAHLAFRLPIFGELNIKSGLVDFCNTLALLLEAGVPIIECLEIVKDSAGNILFRDSIVRCIEDIKKGYPLSAAMSKEPNFPPIVGQMAVVGEETGTSAERFLSLGQFFENEVDQIVKNLSTAIEPLIIVVLGVMVALLIFSVIVPIYSLIASF